MKLVDLEPRWVGAGGEGVSDAQGQPVPARHGVGLTFLCPCGKADHGEDSDTIYVCFANPLDGGEPYPTSPSHPMWQRTGETFETLTLTPSILRTLGCGWHGWVRAGEIVS